MWITNCKSTLCVFARSVCTNVKGLILKGENIIVKYELEPQLDKDKKREQYIKRKDPQTYCL